jgi:hypothetical protein
MNEGGWPRVALALNEQPKIDLAVAERNFHDTGLTGDEATLSSASPVPRGIEKKLRRRTHKIRRRNK